MQAMYDLYMTWPVWLRELAIKGAFAGAAMGFVSLLAMFSIWLERKVSGDIQNRMGPMRVGGWHGWAQSMADGIKLISKEDLIPAGADRLLFRLAPYLAFVPVYAAFMVLPWSRDLSVLSGSWNVGIFFILAMLGLEVLGVIIAGWASNNKWSIYGAMREACQMVSYEIPLGLAIICAVMVAGTLNFTTISLQQGAGLHVWKLFHDPFNFIAFILYFVAALASCKRAPFDLPESESELVAGFHTEYSGMRFGFFFFAEYAGMFIVSAIQVCLWLGAWYDPFGVIAGMEAASRSADGTINWPMLLGANGLGLALFIGKSFLLVWVQIWIRWTLPRIRIDQVLYACVKVMLPIAVVNLMAAAVYMWLMEDLPTVRFGVQIGLMVVGVGVVLLMVATVIRGILLRPTATAYVLFPNKYPLHKLPGA